jgi:hypothetical protein
VGGATQALAPQAHAAPAPEVEYLYDVAVRRHYNFPNNDAVSYGHGICDKVTRGENYAQVMGDVKSDVTPNDEFAANYLVSYAVNLLCSDQIWQLRNSAAHYQPPAQQYGKFSDSSRGPSYGAVETLEDSRGERRSESALVRFPGRGLPTSTTSTIQLLSSNPGTWPDLRPVGIPEHRRASTPQVISSLALSVRLTCTAPHHFCSDLSHVGSNR